MFKYKLFLAYIFYEKGLIGTSQDKTLTGTVIVGDR